MQEQKGIQLFALLHQIRFHSSKIGLSFAVAITVFPCVSGLGFAGINFKLASYNNPPYEVLIRQPNGNYTLGGTTVNMANWVAERLNYTITIVPVFEDALIAKIGVYETAIQKVVNKEVDGLLAGLVITPDRKERMDYTSMIWTEPFTLVVPKPEQESRLLAFIRPFQPLVWLFLTMTTIIMIGTMSFFSWFYKNYSMGIINGENGHENMHSRSGGQPKLEQLVNRMSFYTIYVINVLTNHGIYTPYIQNSFRILAGCWLLAALVLVNSYSSIVVSSMTLPQMKPAINSFEDLAASSDVSIILREDLVVTRQILGATSGILKTLGDQARQKPADRLLLDISLIFKKLESGRYAFPFIRSFTRFIVTNQFKKDGKCRFQLSDSLPVSSGYFCFFLQKNSKYTAEISKSLVELWETGLTRRWVEQTVSYRKADKCFVKNEKAQTSTLQLAIKLEDLSSAFFILGIGVGLAILTLLVEMSIGSRLRGTKRNRA